MSRSVKVQNYKYQIIAGLLLVAVTAAGLFYRAHHQAVLSSAVPPAPITDNCAGLDPRYRNAYSCYKTELTSIIKQDSPERATKLVQQQYAAVAYVKSNCHQLMHVIGRAAYAKYGNLADTFAHGSQYCNGGYYHGLSEQLGDEQGAAYLTKNADTLCAPIAAKKGRYSFYHYNCVHGLGHAFMEVLHGELFQSLQGCDLIHDQWERSSCYGGVFMQNIMIEQSPDDSLDHTSKYLKTDDPMYPCNAVEDKYKDQCYLMQTSHALALEGSDFAKVFSLCDAVEGSYRDTCYTSLGRDAAGQAVYDAARTQSLCLKGGTAAAQSQCLVGALRDYVDNFQSDKQAQGLCVNLSQAMAANCRASLKTYYAHF
jgi:hypothetical protein